MPSSLLLPPVTPYTSDVDPTDATGAPNNVIAFLPGMHAFYAGGGITLMADGTCVVNGRIFTGATTDTA
jgi:hypothetical protein